MRQRLAGHLKTMLFEESTLFWSLGKWTLLGAAVGALAGCATTLFVWMLEWAVAQAARAPQKLLLLPPGLMAAHLVVRWLAPQASGHGTEKVIEAIHRRWGRIPLLVAPVKMVAAILTIATGGSVGKEGPAVQIAATLASGLASLFRLTPQNRRKLVICGVSAGFSTVLGTPIGGALFGLEVLVLGTLFYDVLYPSLVAGVVGYEVARRLGLTYFHQGLPGVPAPTAANLLTTVVAGIAFGLVSFLLIEASRLADEAARRLPGPRWVLAGAGGVLLAVLAWLVSDRYLGLGRETVQAAVQGAGVPPAAFLLKIVFTVLSFAAGGSGGIIFPILFVGATAGSALAPLLGFDPGTLAAMGCVAVLAGAANAPLAGSVMAIELFGPAVAPLAALGCVVSYLMVGHRSIHGTQVLGIAKTPLVRVTAGVELDAARLQIRRLRFRRLRLVWRALQGSPERASRP